MSDTVSCGACKKRMASVAVVCPHCGVRQVERDPVDPKRSVAAAQPTSAPAHAHAHAKPVLRGVSPDEVAALLAVEAVRRGEPVDDPPRAAGTLADMLLPRWETRARYRELEISLTIAALPLLVSAFAMLPYFRRRSFEHPSYILIGSVIGGAVAMQTFLTFALGWSNSRALWMIGGCVAALAMRGIVRARGRRRAPTL